MKELDLDSFENQELAELLALFEGMDDALKEMEDNNENK